MSFDLGSLAVVEALELDTLGSVSWAGKACPVALEALTSRRVLGFA